MQSAVFLPKWITLLGVVLMTVSLFLFIRKGGGKAQIYSFHFSFDCMRAKARRWE